MLKPEDCKRNCEEGWPKGHEAIRQWLVGHLSFSGQHNASHEQGNTGEMHKD